MGIAMFADRFTAAARALAAVSTALQQIEITSGDMPTRFLDALNGPQGAFLRLDEAARLALAEAQQDVAKADAMLVSQFPGGPQSVAELAGALAAVEPAVTDFNTLTAETWAQLDARIRVIEPSPVTGAMVGRFDPVHSVPAAIADPFRADPRVAAQRAALTGAGA